MPSENEISGLDGKKPGEPRKMLPSENEISGLDGKKPGEPRKMLPSENEICELDGKGKVGFGKFCHQKTKFANWMAREK